MTDLVFNPEELTELLEDAAGFRIHTTPCGSGGRLMEEDAYDASKASSP
jgi:hypothetical protein